jgi:hypothetical protein
VAQQGSTLHFGTNGTGSAFLADGWSASDRTFTWSDGNVARLRGVLQVDNEPFPCGSRAYRPIVVETT